MAQTNKGLGPSEIAIAILNNNGGASLNSTADRSHPSAADAEPLQQPKAAAEGDVPGDSKQPKVPAQGDVPGDSKQQKAPAEGDLPLDSKQPKAKMKPKFDKFLSTTAKLGYFLPTGTTLLFDTAVTKIYINGQCSYIRKMVMWLLIGLCVAICVFSHFPDIVNSDNTKENRNKKVEYKIVKRLDFADGVHAITSVIAFLTIAFSDQRVVDCVLPAHVKEVEEVMLSLDIIVLSICSFVYLAFPSKKSGMVPKFACREKVQS